MTAVDNLRRPVDGHVLSHTRFCGWARTFTHTSYVPLPTRTYPQANSYKASRNRNARAFLTLRKAFNASGGGKPNSGRRNERPLAAYGAGRKHPPAGTCKVPLSAPTACRVDPLQGPRPPLP